MTTKTVIHCEVDPETEVAALQAKSEFLDADITIRKYKDSPIVDAIRRTATGLGGFQVAHREDYVDDAAEEPGESDDMTAEEARAEHYRTCAQIVTYLENAFASDVTPFDVVHAAEDYPEVKKQMGRMSVSQLLNHALEGEAKVFHLLGVEGHDWLRRAHSIFYDLTGTATTICVLCDDGFIVNGKCHRDCKGGAP